jgi:hypothetical protein
MLKLLSVDESHLRAFVDQQRLGPDEHESVLRILFALPRFPLVSLQRWHREDPPGEQIVNEPDRYRGEVFFVAGRVQTIEVKDVLPEAVRRLRFEHYYRIALQVDRAPFHVTLLARKIPQAWQDAVESGRPVTEPASCWGMFLKVGRTAEDRPGLVFATARVAWHPTRADDGLGTTVDHTRLGDLGMDIGLFDDVQDGQSMGGGDRECFYQLLAAVGKVGSDQLIDHARPDPDISVLLSKPRFQHGKLFSLAGVARRAIRIPVNDPDIRERFGIDHYYEIEVFVPLEKDVLIKMPHPGAEGKLFNPYPVVFCARRLPRGMPDGEDIHEAVRIAGFFFKLWAYQSDFMAPPAAPDAGPGVERDQQRGAGPRQFSPLLIGVEPQLTSGRTGAGPTTGIGIGVAFVVALLGVWLWLWRSSRRDRQFHRAARTPQFPLDTGQSGEETSEGKGPV